MKIAIFHELDFGGAKRTVDALGKRLNKIFDVDLYYVGEKKEKNDSKNYKNIFYYPFHSRLWKGNDWKGKLYKDTVELFSLYNLHKKIARDINSKGYNYVFVHPSKFTQAPFLLRFLKNKSVYFCQEPLRIAYDPYLSDISYIKFPKNIYEFVNRMVRKWIDGVNFKGANIVLANSKFSKEFIEESYGKQATLCYLGVDVVFFKPYNIKKTIDILFIGNENDGYSFLNSMSERFNNKNKFRIHAIFRGEGLPGMTDKELLNIYNKSKVLVALNHNEPFGLIPLEAMACGTPVIAVDEGGYNESVINNKTGFLISRNPNEFYDAISKIISNEKIREKMGRNARENVLRNWTWGKTIDRFLEIINYEK